MTGRAALPRGDEQGDSPVEGDGRGQDQEISGTGETSEQVERQAARQQKQIAPARRQAVIEQKKNW